MQVISDEDANGQVTLSIRRLEFERAWERVETMHKNDAVFEASVVAVNKGGAIVEVEGLRAFLPGSHLCGGQPTEELVGTKLPFKFLEVCNACAPLVSNVYRYDAHHLSTSRVIGYTLNSASQFQAETRITVTDVRKLEE